MWTDFWPGCREQLLKESGQHSPYVPGAEGPGAGDKDGTHEALLDAGQAEGVGGSELLRWNSPLLASFWDLSYLPSSVQAAPGPWEHRNWRGLSKYQVVMWAVQPRVAYGN